MRIRYRRPYVSRIRINLGWNMEDIQVVAEVFHMTTLVTIAVELALIGVVIACLPYILGFIAVCFVLACIFSLVTGIASASK